MPFQYILANLLAHNDGAIGVLFVDETGETVDVSCAEGTPYEMKVIGAYMGIYFRQMEEVLDRAELGRPEILHIEKDDVHFFTAPLPDGYHLVLVQRNPGMTGIARRTLIEARDQIAREIFS